MNFLITGGASGLGHAITSAIAGKHPDAKIYFTYYSSGDKARALEQMYLNTKGIKCDFTAASDLQSLCNFINESGIDVLVNNAITKLNKQYFHKTAKKEFAESFSADVLATLQIAQSFITKARERKSGKIITILSAALFTTPPTGWSVYLANKAYLLSMHKSWATENKAFNITSNCVSPEFLATPLHGEMDERVAENMIRSHPLKKLLTVEEVAETVLFLSNASSQLNGQNIVLNAAMNL